MLCFIGDCIYHSTGHFHMALNINKQTFCDGGECIQTGVLAEGRQTSEETQTRC